MSLEAKQLKNIRNRIFDYIKTVPPQKLVELAIFCRVKVPDEVLKKYSAQKVELE